MIRRLALAAALLLASGRVRAQQVHRVERAWPVMGTMFVATVWATDTTAALEAIRAARDSVRLVDSLMSTYRPESEISRINALAGVGDAAVSPQTLHVLLLARRYWAVSRGLFDPTVGPLVRAWHVDSAGRVPSRATIDSLKAVVGFGRVRIDSARSRAYLPVKGMALDFGGIAKGYALDLARAAMRDPALVGGTLDLGGNILAFGKPPAAAKWIIGIAHPRRRDRVLGTVAIDSGAVATSGDYEHFFMLNGVRYGHIIDPTTGYPRRGVLSATAIGPRGQDSDGLSATLFLLGPKRGAAFADSTPGIAAIWVPDAPTPRAGRTPVVLSRRAATLFQRCRGGCERP